MLDQSKITLWRCSLDLQVCRRWCSHHMMSLVIPLVATKLHGNTPAVSPNVHVLTKNGEGEKIGSKYLWVKSDLICMGLCWQMNFWLRLCGPLRMHTAIAGLPFEAMELWLLWAKNAVGVLGRRVWEHVLGDVLVREGFKNPNHGFLQWWGYPPLPSPHHGKRRPKN